MRIGLISDTHGLLRPQALDFLRGCDHVVHGGDIGTTAVLEGLAALAPLTAVRGNNDKGPWADALPEVAQARLSGVLVLVLHDLAQLDLDPGVTGVRVVVSGHSHKPRIEQREGVWYVNPGSAGPRRFRLPVSVGELVIAGGVVRPRIHELS